MIKAAVSGEGLNGAEGAMTPSCSFHGAKGRDRLDMQGEGTSGPLVRLPTQALHMGDGGRDELFHTDQEGHRALSPAGVNAGNKSGSERGQWATMVLSAVPRPVHAPLGPDNFATATRTLRAEGAPCRRPFAATRGPPLTSESCLPSTYNGPWITPSYNAADATQNLGRGQRAWPGLAHSESAL